MIRALVVSTGLLVAGVLICSAGVAEARPQSQDQTSASGTSTAAKPKPKKVWTNDDMGGVTGTISVVGTPTPQGTAVAPRSSSISSMRPGAGNTPGQNKATNAQSDAAKSGDGSVDPKTLAQMKQQLQTLQAGIEQVDKQIEQLKDASRGDSKNMGVLTKDLLAYSTASVPDQIKALEAKRSALQSAMDQLLDTARASGIEPGQLR
ncbi:MAG: hypothetical protein JO260_06120 [Acidobacteria bacterium]|nr:hypothetical protein [Acidobacteriota bacterium]